MRPSQGVAGERDDCRCARNVDVVAPAIGVTSLIGVLRSPPWVSP